MSRLVLIADADPQRADRLRECCAVRGYATRAVGNGADALEAAVAEPPEVLVAIGDLALLDSARLVEILRVNPRTRWIRFLLVGAPVAPRDVWGAEELPEDTDPDEVGERVAQLVARSSQLDAVVGESREEVEGRLSQIPLPDLLQLLHLNRRTGSIELRRRSPEGRSERGRVEIEAGDVVRAAVGTVAGEKAFYRLLGWGEGSFAFRSGPVSGERRIRTSTRALLMEGLRQLDEARRLRGELPALDAHVTLRVPSGDLPSAIHPLTQEVLLLLELYSRVGDVVDRCSFPDYQVLRTVQTLVQRGIAEVRPGPPPPPPDAGFLHPAQVRRLREWIGAPRPESGALLDAKVLLASPDPSLTRDFLELLREFPGHQLRGEPEDLQPHTLGPVARLRIDGELGLELLHVPCETSFAPLWPLAGYRALGALLLVGSSLVEAEATLGPLRSALREGLGPAPRGRLLRMLVLRPGEAAPVAELREHAHLLEDASSLVLLPLEARKSPAERLRGALARLVP